MRRFLRRCPIVLFPALFVAAILLGSHLATGNLIKGWALLRVPAVRALDSTTELSPFADLRGTLSAIECASHGIDVYAANPCDPWRRPFNYPQTWLLLSKFGLTTEATPYIGFVLVLAFLLAAYPLFETQDRRHSLAASIVLASPPVLLGLERGNLDLLVFPLLVLALRLMPAIRDSKRAWRAVPLLAVATVGGALKLYPLAALAALWRTRGGLLLSVGASLATFGVLALAYGRSFFGVIEALPTGFYHAYGYASLIGAGGPFEHSAGALPTLRILLVVACVVALILGRRLASRIARLTASLSVFEYSGFNAAASLYALSFLSGATTDYRLIFLLPAYPALLRWSKNGPAPLAWTFIVGLPIFFWSNAGARWLVIASSAPAWALFIAAGTYLFGTVVNLWAASFRRSNPGEIR